MQHIRLQIPFTEQTDLQLLWASPLVAQCLQTGAASTMCALAIKHGASCTTILITRERQGLSQWCSGGTHAHMAR